jgi:hypothetical protein
MSDLRLRARSVTEIVDAAFQLYKRDALEYILVTAIAYAPVVVAQLILLRGITALGAARMSLTGTVSLIIGLVNVVVYALMSGVLSRFASDVYLGKPTGLREVVASVFRLVPALIAGTLGVAILLMLGFVPVFLGIGLGIPLLTGLGVPFAFGWALYAFARFFAVFQVIVLERPDVLRAFSRSSMLSRGRKGHILLTMLLVLLIFIVVSLATTMVAGILGSMAASLALQTLYTVVAYPLIGITQVILYYDTRIRAEGFDIELMAGALGADAPSAVS